MKTFDGGIMQRSGQLATTKMEPLRRKLTHNIPTGGSSTRRIGEELRRIG
jgi:hypothetical protein